MRNGPNVIYLHLDGDSGRNELATVETFLIMAKCCYWRGKCRIVMSKKKNDKCNFNGANDHIVESIEYSKTNESLECNVATTHKRNESHFMNRKIKT